MKKDNIVVTVALVAIVLFMALVYTLIQPNQNGKSANENTNQNQEQISPKEGQGDTPTFSPDYGDLTEDQIRIADRAVGDLLNSTEGLTPNDIAVQSFEEKNFNDASLGCPQEGQSYAQVVTQGYQVILEAQGQTYDYRLAGEDQVMLCEQ